MESPYSFLHYFINKLPEANYQLPQNLFLGL